MQFEEKLVQLLIDVEVLKNSIKHLERRIELLENVPIKRCEDCECEDGKCIWV